MNTIFPNYLGTFAACQVFNLGGPGAPAMRAAVGFTNFQRLDVGDYRLTHQSIRLFVEAIVIISQITFPATPTAAQNINVIVESDTQFRMICGQLPLGTAADCNFYAIIRRFQ